MPLFSFQIRADWNENYTHRIKRYLVQITLLADRAADLIFLTTTVDAAGLACISTFAGAILLIVRIAVQTFKSFEKLPILN